jgi:hypothetical protein
MSIDGFGCTPNDLQTGVGREQGLKGIKVKMVATAATAFPLNVGAASVTLTANGAPHTCTGAAGVNPASGACGFVLGTTAINGDSVVIYFNGLLNANQSVVAAVSGVLGADATAQGSVPPSITFTTGGNAPRNPASLELVFDISGSMASPVATADAMNPSPKSRIDALKASADELYALLGSHAMLGDKVGQLFFGSNVTGTGALGPAHDPSQLSALQTDLSGKGPTDATAMGKGLKAGATVVNADSNSRKFLFLFSDGEQNFGDQIDFPVPPAGPITIAGVPVPAAVKVCSITMGVQSAPGYALQDQMSKVGCPNAQSLFVRPDSPTFAQSDLDTYFGQALTDVLVGDKLEIVKDVVGSVQPGSTASEKFAGNQLDVATSILLSWDVGRQLRPQLKLTAPHGEVIDLTGRTRFGATRAIIDLRFPFRQSGTPIDPKGQWQLDIRDPVDGAGAVAALNYHLMVIGDNQTIATDYQLAIQDPGTGEPIPMRVTLSEGGSPVLGATVSAVLQGPDNALGDILAKAVNPSGTANGNGDLVGSEANAKLLLLLQDPTFLALLKNHSLPIVNLTDTGNTGIYTGTFTGALKEGHYEFLMNVNGTSATNGAFERTRKLTIFVRPKPDPAATGLVAVSTVIQSNGTVLVHLRATPKDRFGSLLGPDYLPKLNITCTPCTVSTAIKDDLNGSYDVSYEVASAATNPTIGLTVFGKNITQTTLNGLTNPVGGRWVGSFHAGGTIPQTNLGGLSPSVSLGGDLEYRVTKTISLETFVGFDRFSASVGNSFHFVHLSEILKFTFGTGNWKPFVFAGGGAYFASAGGTHGGVNAGIGLQRWFNPKFALEGSYTFHSVFVSTGNVDTYSTLQAGARFVFK